MIAPTQLQDLALGLYEIHMGQPFKPVKFLLDGSPFLHHVNFFVNEIVSHSILKM